MGKVTDRNTGLPINGALVQLFHSGQVRFQTTTNANGDYQFIGVQPRGYNAVASKAGYQQQAFGIKPRNNQTTTVNFQLVPTGGTISGHVEDANTMADISGATIEIFLGSTLVTTTTTNATGDYSVTNLLAPNSYRVVASATGYQSAFKSITLSAGGSAVADFELVPTPATLMGTVLDAVTTNPISGATVQVFSGTTQVASTDTDGTGNYTIAMLAPGNYTVRCSAQFYQTAVSGALISAGVNTLNFLLNPDTGAIEGQVTDAINGQPLGGATVEVKQGGVVVATLLTDPSGLYNADDLLPGSYTVTASHPGYQTKTVGAIVVSGMTTTVNIALDPLPGTIAGNVSNGGPIANASITISNSNGIVGNAVTDANGDYSVSGLAPGSYLVSCAATGFQSQFKAAIVTSGTTTTVNFVFIADGGTLEGNVIDSGTTDPIPGARIEVFQGTTLITSTLTDGSGDYQTLTSFRVNIRFGRVQQITKQKLSAQRSLM